MFKEDVTSACSPSLFWDDFVSAGGHRDEKFPILHWKIFLYQYIHRCGVSHKALPKKNTRNMINGQICKVYKKSFNLNLKGIVNDPQWMGAVRMRAQTADKNISIIHDSVNQLTSWSKESIHNAVFSSEKHISSESGEKRAPIKHSLQAKAAQNSSKQVCSWILMCFYWLLIFWPEVSLTLKTS